MIALRRFMENLAIVKVNDLKFGTRICYWIFIVCCIKCFICNIIDNKEEDKYKDTLSSFMGSMVECNNGVTPAIKDYFARELLQSDNNYKGETKVLVAEMEERINNVLDIDMPSCLNEFTNALADKYYYTFKLLWISKISGLTNCDSNCLVDDIDDTRFIFRAMRDVIVLGVQKDLSCSGINIEKCNEALTAILSDAFTSDDYNKQKDNLRLFVDGMIGDLENAYIGLGQDPNMDECKRNMTRICYGKLSTIIYDMIIK